MDLKQIAKDTSKTLISYLTYQAVRIILAQLSETNPPLAYWLNNFSTKSRIQDGEAFLEELLQQKQELAFRIMTVRQHLAEEVTDFLPEMVRTGIQHSNMEHQRRQLEKMTQIVFSDPATSSEGQTDTPTESD